VLSLLWHSSHDSEVLIAREYVLHRSESAKLHADSISEHGILDDRGLDLRLPYALTFEPGAAALTSESKAPRISR
jgi:hypothetical protein